MITVKIAYIVVLMGPYGYVDDAKLYNNYGWTQEQCESIIIPLNKEISNQFGLGNNYYACLPYPKEVNY